MILEAAILQVKSGEAPDGDRPLAEAEVVGAATPFRELVVRRKEANCALPNMPVRKSWPRSVRARLYGTSGTGMPLRRTPWASGNWPVMKLARQGIQTGLVT
jgi:hypothetical protein